MAGQERHPADSVAEGLLSRIPVHQLSFLSLVSLLERLTPEESRVGERGPPGAEAIRFRHDPSLAFSLRDVERIEARKLPRDPADPLSPHRWVYEVTTTFLGLTGSASPLPSYFLEEIAQEDPSQPIQRDFLDLFHHRLIALLYRAVSSYALWSEQTSDLRDRWSCRLFAILGFDRYEAPLESCVGPQHLLRLAPLMAGVARTPRSLGIALQEVLGDSLGEGRVKIREFSGSWVEIENSARMRLGLANNHLARNVMLGTRAFDRSDTFEIDIGPLTWGVYQRFLPDGDLRPLLDEVTKLFLRDSLEYRIKLRLAQGETPQMRLSGEGRLGRDSWLGVKAGDTAVILPDLPILDEPPRNAFPKGSLIQP